MSRRAVAALVATLAASSATPASGSSLWDRVVDPTLADRDYAHKFAVEKEHEAEGLDYEADITAFSAPGGDEALQKGRAILLREAGKAILERFGAATSPDVRLRYDLGHILARLDRWEEARPVLLGALAKAPDDVHASSAWFDVAICDAHLKKRDEEASAYLSALALEDDSAQRSLLLGNLAEARMSFGDMEGARTAAESALLLYSDLSLVRWTLGVILDRSGDEFGAIEQIKHVIADDPHFARLQQPGVFFEPEYEVHYYRALGELATARGLPPKSPDWEFHLFAALHDFVTYSTQAAPDDRWRKRADDHVAMIQLTLNLKTPKDLAKSKK